MYLHQYYNTNNLELLHVLLGMRYGGGARLHRTMTLLLATNMKYRKHAHERQPLLLEGRDIDRGGMAYKRATTKAFLSCIAVVVVTVLVTLEVWDPAATSLGLQLAREDAFAGAAGSSSFYFSKTKRSDVGRATEVLFDPHGNDTMVYLHVQKTGGSAFLEHMVTLQQPVFQKVGSAAVGRAPLELCRMGSFKWKRGGGFMNHTLDIHLEWCPRDMFNMTEETWLVSEKTTGWMCGVHALYVDFVRCLKNVTTYNKMTKWKKHFPLVSSNRMFHYVTLLRHPVLRYLSEYLQTTRGACWPVHDRICDGEVIETKQTPYCADCNLKRLRHRGRNVSRLHVQESLREYLSCDVRWRNNRLTLALADSEQVTCWNRTQYTSEERDKILLESAKENLLKFSFFGILEFQEESGWLFERTFGMEFGIRPPPLPFNSSVANLLLHELLLRPSLYQKVIANNELDLELYWFAVEEFEKRMRAAGADIDTNTLHSLRTLLPQLHVHHHTSG